MWNPETVGAGDELAAVPKAGAARHGLDVGGEDGDQRLAVAEMKARDDWYVSHMQIFEDLNKAIKTHYDMIENAVEAERKSTHMQRALKDRLDEILSAPPEEAAEMVKEIADDLEDDGVLNRSNEEEE